jgi:hypothetical protein
MITKTAVLIHMITKTAFLIHMITKTAVLIHMITKTAFLIHMITDNYCLNSHGQNVIKLRLELRPGSQAYHWSALTVYLISHLRSVFNLSLITLRPDHRALIPSSCFELDSTLITVFRAVSRVAKSPRPKFFLEGPGACSPSFFFQNVLFLVTSQIFTEESFLVSLNVASGLVFKKSWLHKCVYDNPFMIFTKVFHSFCYVQCYDSKMENLR